MLLKSRKAWGWAGIALGLGVLGAGLGRAWWVLTPAGLRDGDIIFQTSLSPQSQAIQLATHSPYSHVGVLLQTPHGLAVFEAAKTVHLTRFDRWVRRGQGWHYVVKRLANPGPLATPEGRERLRQAAERFEGKPYDPYFEWSDERLYCSELVWKMYEQAFGLELGRLKMMKDFDLQNPAVKATLDERFHGQVPLQETVVSPQDLFDSPLLITVKGN